MKREDYNDFYDNVINLYIKELVEYDESQSLYSLNYNKKSKDKIYKYYETKRIEIRNQIMYDSSKPIDRHKTAATMMYAILRSKVFKVNYLKSNLPEPIRLANEYVAFHVALNIIEQYKRHDEKLDGNMDSDYVLILPDTKYESQINSVTDSLGHSFISSCCLSLARIDDVKHFDILAYSTILFLLEDRTDFIIKNN